MAGRLRARAIALMKQLDAGGSGYREAIEHELKQSSKSKAVPPHRCGPNPRTVEPAPRECISCQTVNDLGRGVLQALRHDPRDGALMKRSRSILILVIALALLTSRSRAGRHGGADARSETDVGRSAARRRSAARNGHGPRRPRHDDQRRFRTARRPDRSNADVGKDQRVWPRGVHRLATGHPRQGVRRSVGAEQLESQEFAIPANGGIRVALVATDSTTAEASAGIAGLLRPRPDRARSCSVSNRASFSKWRDESLNRLRLPRRSSNAGAALPFRRPSRSCSNCRRTARGAGPARRFHAASPDSRQAHHRQRAPSPRARRSLQFGYSLPISGGIALVRAEAAASRWPGQRDGSESRRHAAAVASDRRTSRHAAPGANVHRRKGTSRSRRTRSAPSRLPAFRISRSGRAIWRWRWRW